VISRHGKRRNGHARLVSIDMDPTDAATYPASFMNPPERRQVDSLGS
jgi:hypothetical protein